MRFRHTQSRESKFSRHKQFIFFSLGLLAIIVLGIVTFYQFAFAATATLLPNAYVSNVNFPGLATAYTQVDEGATPDGLTISNQRGTHSGDDGDYAELAMQDQASVATATQVVLHVYMNNADTSGRGFDQMRIEIRDGSTVLATTDFTPTSSSSAWRTTTYNGSLSQAQTDNLRARITRVTACCNGPATDQLDNVFIDSVYMSVTYTPSIQIEQASYRWFENSEMTTYSGGFTSNIEYATGVRPFDVTNADFNGDNDVDLVTANYDAGTASVLLGNGDGTFDAKVDYTAGSSSAGVTSADFNNDSDLDLAVANYGTDTVSVLLGNGDGTFNTKSDYLAGLDPYSIVSGDFDQDGAMDMATANYGGDSISVFIGNGDGTFQAKADYGAGDGSTVVIAADFNVDSRADIAVTNGTSNTVSVLLGNGDGTFAPKVDYAVGDSPASISSADFDSDGNADVAVGNGLTDNISILLGNGDGTLQSKADYAVGDGPQSVTSADFNNDGNADLAVANENGDSVSLLLGNVKVAVGQPLAAQDTPVTAPAAGTPFRLRLNLGITNGDLTTGDFKLRFATKSGATCSTDPATYSDLTTTSAIQFYDNSSAPDGAGYASSLDDPTRSGITAVGQSYEEVNPFSVTTTIPTGQDGLWDFTLSMDATAIGTYCLLATMDNESAFNSYSQIAEISTLPVEVDQVSYRWFGDDTTTVPSGTFALQGSYVVSGSPFPIANADLNGDGVIDIATANGTTASVLLGNGDGSFGPKTDYNAGLSIEEVILVDLNSDGAIDLATTGYTFDSSTVSILIGNGDGTFDPRVDYVAGEGSNSLTSADLNGDGAIDLATANSIADSVSILLGNGDGTFQSNVDISVGNEPHFITNADLNDDGFVDLVNTNYMADSVSVLIGNGDGTFDPKVDYTTGDFPDSIFSTDLNNDGAEDLIIANYVAHSVSILIGNGDGTFDPKVDYAVDDTPGSVISADLDNDSIMDVATANSVGTVSIFLGNGDGTFDPRVDYIASDGSNSLTGADLNGDGAIDLAVTNDDSTVSILINEQLLIVNTPLADINTPATIQSTGTPFHLRANLSVTSASLTGTSYKLRYQEKGGASCSFNPFSYVDITTSSEIKFANAVLVNDGADYILSPDDPFRSGITAIGQTYEESNPFSTIKPIPAGQDGLWHFALVLDASAQPGSTYCLMATQTDNTGLNTYTVIPEISLAGAGGEPAELTLDQMMRGGQSVIAGEKVPFSW